MKRFLVVVVLFLTWLGLILSWVWGCWHYGILGENRIWWGEFNGYVLCCDMLPLSLLALYLRD